MVAEIVFAAPLAGAEASVNDALSRSFDFLFNIMSSRQEVRQPNCVAADLAELRGAWFFLQFWFRMFLR